MPNILFLNHTDKQCGVYQFGLRVFNIVKKSTENQYIYKEVTNVNIYNQALGEIEELKGIIYNFHNTTMSWLSPSTIQRKVMNVGMVHESNSFGMFDKLCELDPTAVLGQNQYKIPRPIFENVDFDIQRLTSSTPVIREFITSYLGSSIPIYGSFGFGFRNKGFDKLIKMVNDTHEEAIIKMVIPQAKYGHYSQESQDLKHDCLRIPVKKGIQIFITNEFFSEEEILIFLHSNTMNIFLYDDMPGRGISSAVDYAISAKKPIGISTSYMFRHIYNDKICLYRTPISESMKYSQDIVNKFLEDNSHKVMIASMDAIVRS
jgi:hypothetical protein